MNIALSNWMKENEIENATMTVFGDDKILRTDLYGEDAKEIFDLASLSKSITGACIAHLVEIQKLKYTSSLSDVFGENLEGLNLNALKFSNTTIQQLLTHSSGFYPDSTQTDMPKWVESQRDRHEQVSGYALGRDVQEGVVGRYQYNNENFAILGAVVEHLTGKDYTNYCNTAVLKPLNITTARTSPSYGAYAAWGGWEMSTEDFARFSMGFFGVKAPYGKAPFEMPFVPVQAGVSYGLGTFVRESNIANNFWHHGAICIGDRFQTGAFFAFWGGQLGVVVAYDKCPNWDMMIDLDIVLGRAAFR